MSDQEKLRHPVILTSAGVQWLRQELSLGDKDAVDYERIAAGVEILKGKIRDFMSAQETAFTHNELAAGLDFVGENGGPLDPYLFHEAIGRLTQPESDSSKEPFLLRGVERRYMPGLRSEIPLPTLSKNPQI